jgi:hypothetical protein
MATAVRTARHGFIRLVTRGSARTHSTVFKAPNSPRVDPKQARYIKVVFELKWPDQSQPSVDTAIENAESAVGGSLYRVKGLLEQSLLQEIEVSEIVIGCVKVKYSIPEPTTRELMQKALNRLWTNREFYSVTSVSGHLNGRAVSAT